MNLIHSISTVLPKWIRIDLPDFIKEDECGVWFNTGAIKTLFFPLTSRLYVSMNIGLNLPPNKPMNDLL